MFRFGGVFATLLFLIGAGIVGCGDSSSEPEKLTNRVYLPDKIQAAPGESFPVPVNFYNEVSLAAINVPILYPSALLHLDSVSFYNSRVAEFAFRNVLSNADTLSIGAFDDTAAVASGSGLLATIYFMVRTNAPDTTFSLNTFDYPLLPLSLYDLQLDPVVNPPNFKACSVHIKGPSDGGSGKPN
jgi:hypothetical protein